MTIEFVTEPVPIAIDAHGAVRVGGTRVTLETVIWDYLNGSTPEKIAEDYDTLKLADVYATIGYYLKHRDEIDAYLEETERQGDELRRQIEEHCDAAGWRARLLARKRSA